MNKKLNVLLNSKYKNTNCNKLSRRLTRFPVYFIIYSVQNYTHILYNTFTSSKTASWYFV